MNSFSASVPLQLPHVLFDPAFGPLVMLKFLFIRAKRGRVVVSPPVVVDGRVRNVKHFVEQYIFHHMLRNRSVVERSADNDRFMRRIVMPEHSIGLIRRP